MAFDGSTGQAAPKPVKRKTLLEASPAASIPAEPVVRLPYRTPERGNNGL